MFSFRHRGYRGSSSGSQEAPWDPVSRETPYGFLDPLNPEGTSPNLLNSSSFPHPLTTAGPMWAKGSFRVEVASEGGTGWGWRSWPGASGESPGPSVQNTRSFPTLILQCGHDLATEQPQPPPPPPGLV